MPALTGAVVGVDRLDVPAPRHRDPLLPEGVGVLDRLLRDPALAAEWPAPHFDPNAPGPRRAVVVRLAIGEDEREMQALDGPPYERLAALARALLEFCRSVPLRPAP